MKIALIGYGKMGKAIERIAMERGHEISHRIDRDGNGWEELSPDNTDMAIEFSIPESAASNIRKCLSKGVPIVVGTTGWYDDFDAISTEVAKSNLALLHGTNFSIGVNLFFMLNEQLAQWMGDHDQYRASMSEVHHVHKLDAPSGTAISLAEQIISEHPRYTSWSLDPSSQNDQLGIEAIRENEVPGTHVINYRSPVDRIEIRHEAFNRDGFATGAVVAAEWLQGKSGVYSIRDLFIR